MDNKVNEILFSAHLFRDEISGYITTHACTNLKNEGSLGVLLLYLQSEKTKLGESATLITGAIPLFWHISRIFVTFL